jgi:hypothetical protein
MRLAQVLQPGDTVHVTIAACPLQSANNSNAAATATTGASSNEPNASRSSSTTTSSADICNLSYQQLQARPALFQQLISDHDSEPLVQVSPSRFQASQQLTVCINRRGLASFDRPACIRIPESGHVDIYGRLLRVADTGLVEQVSFSFSGNIGRVCASLVNGFSTG